MAPPETVEVDGDRVACDGGGADGHPRVFLSLRAGGSTVCPYCGRRFVRRPD
ncbi:MAG: zinc-finger domain-containing protein [Rhodospirillales bacterium]|nr:zinc-finger domain-containing protein [Alphaproteobacteria bacterium]MCY4431838.1 zinc-finger domain-containing protein [Rhodospirillales bacterium]